MRFKISLELASNGPGILPLNYQYPLSSCIYKIIENADQEYGRFLHDEGYGTSLKRFKFFTFSDLRTPFKINGNRMVMRTNSAELTVCFHLPMAAENFIKGLFYQQQIDIADQYSKATFSVKQIESVFSTFSNDPNETVECRVKVLSPIVCGRKRDDGNYTFLSPLDSDFVPMIYANWKAKYSTLYGEDDIERVFKSIKIIPVLFAEPPRARLVTIKGGTREEIKIKGFTGFELKLKGNKKAIELLLNTGAGVYNSIGMGSLQVI